MKFSLIFLVSFYALTVSANIQHNELEQRHATLIKTSLDEACGLFRNLEIVSVSVKDIHVDQGITDKNFTTILTGEQKMDQNIFDTYIIEVQSSYSDMYDHSNKDWGVFSVESVKCIMQ